MGRDNHSAPASLWEWQAPLGLLLVGLAMIAGAAYSAAGTSALVHALVHVGVILLVFVPFTILAMIPVAALLKISFGILKTAILKLAAITTFTTALQMLGALWGFYFFGLFLAVVVSYFLFSKFFDLDARATVLAVILIAVIRILAWMLVASLLAALLAALGLAAA
jgi:hypothetical protein